METEDLGETAAGPAQVAAAEYAAVRPRWTAFADQLKELFERLLKQANVDYVQVDARSKDPESLAEKIVRKRGKYASPLQEVTDLCGLRIIVYYVEDVRAVGQLIQQEMIVDEANSRDTRDVLGADQFGYASVHYVAEIGKQRSELLEWMPYKGMRAEIQVRTVLQHAWAAIDHKLRYKTASEAPQALRRDLFRLSALLELADKEFSDLRTTAAQVSDQYLHQVGAGDLDLGLDATSVEIYLEATGALEHWKKQAEKAGFPPIDEYNSSLEATDRRDFISVADRLGMKTIRDLDGSMRRAEEWGTAALISVATAAAKLGYIPRAVPYDVLAMLLLLDHGEAARPVVEAIPYRKEVSDALLSALS